MSRFKYIITCLFLTSKILLAQNTSFHSIRFNQFKTDHGLSNDWINSISEDTNGIMWVGTRHGLNLFDGSSISLFKSENDSDNLGAQDISCILYTTEHQMLVGTWGKGLHVINPYTKAILNKNDGLFEKNLVIKSILQKSDSSIWIGSFGSGLINYTPKNDSYISYTDYEISSPKESFKFIEGMTTQNDTLWVLNTTGQIGFLAPSKSRIQIIKNQDGSILELESDVTAIISYQNQIILGTRNGKIYSLNFIDGNWQVKKIIQLSEASDSKYRIKSFRITKNTLWIASSYNFYKFDLFNKELIEYKSPVFDLEYKSVITSFVDSRDILWLGTWGQGLLYKSDLENTFSELPLKLPSDYVVTDLVTFDEDNFLIGTNKGLRLYCKSKQEINVFPAILNGRKINTLNVNGIALFKDYFIINFNDLGLFFMNRNGELSAVKGVSNFNLALFTKNILTKDYTHWFGSHERGILKISEKTGEVNELLRVNSSSKLQTNTVLSFCEASNSMIWIGKRDGLFKYNPRTDKIQEEHLEIKIGDESLPIQSVISIVEDANGNLWLATINGLFKYDLEIRKVEHISKGITLGENKILNMILIGDNIWASSMKGLFCINVNTKKVSKYSSQNGLSSDAFNERGVLYMQQEKTLYLCNGNSIVTFKPNEVSDYVIPRKIKLINFFVNEKAQEPISEYFENTLYTTNEINLPYNKNNIALEISIQDFNPFFSGKKYYSKLSGHDKDYVEHNYDETVLRYSNLDAGDYELEIRLSNSDGSMTDESLLIKINIDTPFWEKWWVILLFTLCLSYVAYKLYTYKSKKILLEKEEFEKIIEERTKEIYDTNKQLVEQEIELNQSIKEASQLLESSNPSIEKISEVFPNYFLLSEQNSLVSVDFYQVGENKKANVFAVGENIENGISGAFLGALNSTNLSQLIEESRLTDPLEIYTSVLDKGKHLTEKNSDSIKKQLFTLFWLNKEDKTFQIISDSRSFICLDKNKEIYSCQEKIVNHSDNKISIFSSAIEDISRIYFYNKGIKALYHSIAKENEEFELSQTLSSTANLTCEEQQRILENEIYVIKKRIENKDDLLLIRLDFD